MKIYQWKTNLLEIQLSTSAKLLGFVLSEYYRPGKECFPSISTLMETSGLGSRNTIIKAIKELELCNLITVFKKRMLNNSRESNIYIFNGVDNEPSTEPSTELSTEPSKSILEDTKTTKTTKKIEKRKFGDFKNVSLSKEEFEKLELLYKHNFDNAIERLSSYIESSGRKYKSHYAVLAQHNWVYKEIMGDK